MVRSRFHAHRLLGRAGACAVLAAAVGWGIARPAAQAQAGVRVLPVRGNTYMLLGAGGNITVLDGPQGVMLVDAGPQGMTDAVLAAVRRITTRPIHFLLNTNGDMDHVGGNLAIGKAGAVNAALLAAGVLALADQALAARLEAWRARQTAAVAEHPKDEA